MVKVSIIVPIYGVEAYLAQCVESLLMQTHTNLEIILINDGSPDSSGNICDAYATQDSRVLVIHKENGGLSSARNAGLDRSSGEYICFVDADDWVEPDYVTSLLNAAVRVDADIAVCGFTNDLPAKSEVRGFVHGTSTVGSRDALKALYGPDYLILTVAWNKLYRSELFREHRFYEGMIHEDEAIIATLFLDAQVITCFNTPLYHYRIRSGSITDQSRPVSIDGALALEHRLRVLRSRGVDRRLFQLTVRKLLTVVLGLFARGSASKTGFVDGVNSADFLGMLREYLPLVTPRYHPVAIWSSLTLLAPGPLSRVYGLRLSARATGSRLVNRVRQAAHPLVDAKAAKVDSERKPL